MSGTLKIILAVAAIAAVIGGALLLNNLLTDKQEDFNNQNNNNNQQNENEQPELPQQPQEGEPIQPPQENEEKINYAPDFTVYDDSGNAVKLSDFRGKAVVVNFWASWCYYCKVEMADFYAAYQKYDNVVFLMVNATAGNETQAVATKYMDSNGYYFEYLTFDLQSSAASAYSVSGIPRSLFINADGSLYKSHTGALSQVALETYVKAITDNQG